MMGLLNATWNSTIGQFRQRQFVTSLFSLTAARVFNLSIGVVSMLLFGTVFAKSQIAVIGLFDMVGGLMLSFGFTWSAAGLVRFGKEELRERQGLSYTSSTRLYIIAPLLAAAVLCMVIFRHAILQYIGTDQSWFILCMIGSLTLLAANEHLTQLFTTREKHIANSLFYIAQGLGKLLILVAFMSRFVAADPLFYLAAIVCLDALLFCIRLPWTAKPYLFPLCRVQSEDTKTFFLYVAPQIYGFAGLYVINWIDIYFIRQHCAMDDLGAYQFMYSIFTKLASFAILTNTLLFPRVMAWKQARPDAVKKFTGRGPQWVMLGAIFASGAMLLAYRPMFNLFFGDKYIVAYSSLVLLIACLPFCFLKYVFVPVLNSFDRVKYIQTVNILSAGCNFLLDAVLVPRFGIAGAALATFVAYGVVAVGLAIPVHRMFGLQWHILAALILALSVFAAMHFSTNALFAPAINLDAR